MIRERIKEAMDLDLPGRLLNLMTDYGIYCWPLWLKNIPGRVPSCVVSATEKGDINHKTIIIQVGGNTFKFSKIKTGQDPYEEYGYVYSYWDYEISFAGSYVFGIKIREDIEITKPEFIEVDGFIPGNWVTLFIKLIEDCQELVRKNETPTLNKSKDTKSEEETLRKKKFGLE